MRRATGPAADPGNTPRTAEVPLSALKRGSRGRVARVVRDLTGRADRLAALGVTRGATVRVLQTFPAIVFECDQTELAVERATARNVLIEVQATQGPAGGGGEERRS